MNTTEKFWDATYKKNIGKLIGTCYRYVHNKQLAEDLAHDAFITAINKAETFKGKGEFEAWLRRVVVNTALMHLRRKHADLYTDDLTMHENKAMEKFNNEHEPTLIDSADFSKDELLEAIQLLPEHHKMVFNLYVIDGYTHQQIGDELGISAGTSKSHLARARKKLQQILNEKAQAKQRKKDWKRALIILIWPGNAKGVDAIYKEKFINYSLPTNHILEVSQIVFNKITQPIIKSAFITWKSIVIALSVFTTVSLLYLSKGYFEKTEARIIINDTVNFTIPKPDTLTLKHNIDSIKKASTPTPSLKSGNKPIVVVKKKIKKTPMVVKKELVLLNDDIETENIDKNLLIGEWALLNNKHSDTVFFTKEIPKDSSVTWTFKPDFKFEVCNYWTIKETNAKGATVSRGLSWNWTSSKNNDEIQVNFSSYTTHYRIKHLTENKLVLIRLNERATRKRYYLTTPNCDSSLFYSDTILLKTLKTNTIYGYIDVLSNSVFNYSFNFKTSSYIDSNGEEITRTIADIITGAWKSPNKNELINFTLKNGEKYKFNIKKINETTYFIKQ